MLSHLNTLYLMKFKPFIFDVRTVNIIFYVITFKRYILCYNI